MTDVTSGDVDPYWLQVIHGVKIELSRLDSVTYDVNRRMLTLTLASPPTVITRTCSALDAAQVLQLIGDLHA